MKPQSGSASFPHSAATETYSIDAQVIQSDGPTEVRRVDRVPVAHPFVQPVAFAITVDIEIGDDGSVAAPLAVLVDDAGNGELVGLDVDLDLDAGIAVVSGTIGHFSLIVEHSGALAIGLEEISPKERAIGVPWEAGAVVRNVSLKGTDAIASLKDRDLLVMEVLFEGLGEVEVVGSPSHPGFTLESGATQTLDFPVPRWQCRDVGGGFYRVVARAEIGGGIVSNWVRVGSQGANTVKSLWGLDSLVDDINYDYAVFAQVSVECVEPEYEASRRSGKLTSVTGRVDPNLPFDLEGTYPGGTVTLSFVPDMARSMDEEAYYEMGGILVDGTYTYTGGGSGSKLSGSGTFLIEVIPGQPLILHYAGNGCSDPGGGAPKICAPTRAEITLTPVQP